MTAYPLNASAGTQIDAPVNREAASVSAGQTWGKVNWLVSVPFFLAHVAAVVGCWWVGFSWRGVAIAGALYFVRMFAVTGG